MTRLNQTFVRPVLDHVEMHAEDERCRTQMRALHAALEDLCQSGALEGEGTRAGCKVAQEAFRLFQGSPRLKLYVSRGQVLVKTAFGCFLVRLEQVQSPLIPALCRPGSAHDGA